MKYINSIAKIRLGENPYIAYLEKEPVGDHVWADFET
jgi:hypothetical protein